MHGAALMLLPDEDVDWEAYDAIKPYSSPELRSRKVRLALCARMWLAGRSGTCSECFEKLCVFNVLKRYVKLDGKEVAITRLVADLRRSNLRWKTPPRVLLGSPLWTSYVDLSENITKGRVPTSCHGNLPDF